MFLLIKIAQEYNRMQHATQYTYDKCIKMYDYCY